MLLLFKSRNCRVKLPWFVYRGRLRRADAVVGQFFRGGIWVIWVSSPFDGFEQASRSVPLRLVELNGVAVSRKVVIDGHDATLVRIFLNVMTPETGIDGVIDALRQQQEAAGVEVVVPGGKSDLSEINGGRAEFEGRPGAILRVEKKPSMGNNRYCRCLFRR